MNDTQFLTLAICIGTPLSLVLYGNSQIRKARESLGTELQVLQPEVDARFSLSDKMDRRFEQLESKMDRGFERLNQKLDMFLKILADREAKLPK